MCLHIQDKQNVARLRIPDDHKICLQSLVFTIYYSMQALTIGKPAIF